VRIGACYEQIADHPETALRFGSSGRHHLREFALKEKNAD